MPEQKVSVVLKILLQPAQRQQKENIFTVPFLQPAEIFHFHFSVDRRKIHRAAREGTRFTGEKAAAQPNRAWACLADEYRSYVRALFCRGSLFAKTPGICSISLPWDPWVRPVCSMSLLGDSDFMKDQVCVLTQACIWQTRQFMKYVFTGCEKCFPRQI